MTKRKEDARPMRRVPRDPKRVVIPPLREHVDLTARLLGDPLPGRSALDARTQK